MRETKITTPRGGRPTDRWDEEDLANLRELFSQGFGPLEISQKMGMSRGQVSNKLLRLGMRRRDCPKLCKKCGVNPITPESTRYCSDCRNNKVDDEHKKKNKQAKEVRDAKRSWSHRVCDVCGERKPLIDFPLHTARGFSKNKAKCFACIDLEKLKPKLERRQPKSFEPSKAALILPNALDLIDQGLTNAEAAKRLNLTRGQLAGALHRARLRGEAINHPRARVETPTPRPSQKQPKRSATGCRWIEDDVIANPHDWDFCGEKVAHVGEAWCAAHRARVYVRASPS